MCPGLDVRRLVDGAVGVEGEGELVVVLLDGQQRGGGGGVQKGVVVGQGGARK